MSALWHTAGSRISWFFGRRWSWRPTRREFELPIFFKIVRFRGRVIVVKLHVFGLAAFWDRNGHDIPKEAR